MKFFKNKSKKTVKSAEPRPFDDIKKEYGDLSLRLGILSYEIYVKNKEISQLEGRLETINYEADSRLKLDAAAKEANKESEGSNERV